MIGYPGLRGRPAHLQALGATRRSTCLCCARRLSIERPGWICPEGAVTMVLVWNQSSETTYIYTHTHKCVWCSPRRPQRFDFKGSLTNDTLQGLRSWRIRKPTGFQTRDPVFFVVSLAPQGPTLKDTGAP